MKGFHKASDLSGNSNSTPTSIPEDKDKFKTPAESNTNDVPPVKRSSVTQLPISQPQDTAKAEDQYFPDKDTAPKSTREQQHSSKHIILITVVIVAAIIGCVFLLFPKGERAKPLNTNSSTINTSNLPSDSTAQSSSTDENNQVEIAPTSTPIAPEDKNYTVADIYEHNNISNLLAEYKSVNMVQSGENGKNEVTFYQSNGHLGMTRIVYDTSGTPTSTYVCNTDYNPFSIVCSDDGYNRSVMVYIASDLDELVRGYWGEIENVKDEQITETGIENGMVVVTTSGQDTWGDSVNKVYYIDPNTDNITHYDVSYSGQAGQSSGTISLTYDAPAIDTTSFVDGLIHVDGGNEMTFVSKVDGVAGSCTIQTAPGSNVTVSWARSPVSAFLDEALTNQAVLISNPGTYYVAEDLIQEWDGN